MGLTPAERKANSRAVKKGLERPFKSVTPEEKAEREAANTALMTEIVAQDAKGYYKSECRSCADLFAIYQGVNILAKESEDEEDEEDEEAAERKPKKPKSKKSPANPSAQRITIPEFDRGVDEQGNPKTDAGVDEVVSFWRWLDLRDKARKDLYWNCKLLGKDLFPGVHQITCDQFVQKNFDGMYRKGYTLGDFHKMIDVQERFDISGQYTKEMMLLDSRGFYKSAIDGVDCVNWLINCPDVHIFIITGEYKLAVQFLQEIKEYFYLAKGAEPSAFQLLFPEYILTGVAGRSKQPMKCPARILKQKGHSVWVNAIVANLSGWHCDVKKGDDIVTDENSNTPDAREKIKTKYDGTGNLLDPHGFEDHIGTRYFTDDWYGSRLTPNKETGELAPIKYHKRGCWVVKPEYADVPLVRLTEEMVNLTFPQLGKTPSDAFNKLRSKLLKKDGERGFRNQQLNEPTDAKEDAGFIVTFTEDALRKNSYQLSAAPNVGDIVIAWDTAISDRKTSDYSVGAVGRIFLNGQSEYGICVLEIVYDKWNYSELALQVLQLSKKWNVPRPLIEKTNGTQVLEEKLRQLSQKLDFFIDPYMPIPSNKPNAKRNRIKGLEILLTDGRLKFVLGSWIDETYKQFTNFTGERDTGRKDDIPDAVSYLTKYLPASALKDNVTPEEIAKEQEETTKKAVAKAQYDRMFGGPTPVAPPPSESEPPQQDIRQQLFGKIFGGNGLRA